MQLLSLINSLGHFVEPLQHPEGWNLNCWTGLAPSLVLPSPHTTVGKSRGREEGTNCYIHGDHETKYALGGQIYIHAHTVQICLDTNCSLIASHVRVVMFVLLYNKQPFQSCIEAGIETRCIIVRFCS